MDLGLEFQETNVETKIRQNGKLGIFRPIFIQKWK